MRKEVVKLPDRFSRCQQRLGACLGDHGGRCQNAGSHVSVPEGTSSLVRPSAEKGACGRFVQKARTATRSKRSCIVRCRGQASLQYRQRTRKTRLTKRGEAVGIEPSKMHYKKGVKRDS